MKQCYLRGRFTEAAPAGVIVAMAAASAGLSRSGSTSSVAEQKRAAIRAVILQGMRRRHSNHRPRRHAGATAAVAAAAIATIASATASSQSGSRCHRFFAHQTRPNSQLTENPSIKWIPYLGAKNGPPKQFDPLKIEQQSCILIAACL